MDEHAKLAISALSEMKPAQLRLRYRELFGHDARSGHRQWLLRRCAWRIQALAEGDIDKRVARVRRRATEIADDADVRLVAPPAPTPDPTAPCDAVPVNRPTQDARLPVPGTVLVRTYKGRDHIVKVWADGFEYDNRVFKSLSAVSYAISGSHWNGFVFFQKELSKAKRERAQHD